MNIYDQPFRFIFSPKMNAFHGGDKRNWVNSLDIQVP